MDTLILTTWIPINPDDWKPEDETELNDNLGTIMDEWIENRSYLKYMPNGIMITQDRNVAKFLDTYTGEFKCFGYFTETPNVRYGVA